MEKIYYNHYHGIAAKTPEEVGKQIAKKHWEQKFVAIIRQSKKYYRAICVDHYGDAHSYSINKVEIIGG